ncbi:hypothetical protein [Pedobacter sp. MW01-1-1]|uniref:hypothetical protein n=1 Tax=Pedobacter sp. MW01-1-1 TaxID=3383027 RepID=UPI003FF07BCF
MKNVLFLGIILLFHKSNAQTSSKMTSHTQESYFHILKSQLSTGVSGEKYETDYPVYTFSIADMAATESIIANELANHGYIKPSEDEFGNRIKNIFHRVINQQSNRKYLMICFDIKCSVGFNLFKNSNAIDADPYSIYIFKKGAFISDFFSLPEILDYTKYPELVKLEDSIKINNRTDSMKIYYWNDISDLNQQRKHNIQTIVARNMYLFNDNKAQYKWLILHDEYFMGRLVKTFGYTQDLDLLKWAIERTKFNKKNPQDYGKLFWTKQCDGTLKIHSNTFKILQKIYLPNDPSENRFILDNIKEYIEYFADFNNKTTDISREEKIKILANVAYFAEQYKYKKEYNDYNKIMGRLRYFLSGKDIEILKKNNYFGLPNFKEWWDNADYDEYYVTECEYLGACGRDYQPMNITEWRKLHPKEN